MNSQLAAFDIGANKADSDLWVTKDGYIVESHNNDVSGSTNGTGNITSMTLAQVQQLHTGPHNEPIPQLSDSCAISMAHTTGRSLQFETKWSLNGRVALQSLNDQIAAAGTTDHAVIYSAYLPQLQTLESINPALVTWYKAPSPPPALSDLAGLDGILLNAPDVTKANVATYQNAGYTVIRGKVGFETSSNWTHFVNTKADGMMTADPVKVIGECRAL